MSRIGVHVTTTSQAGRSNTGTSSGRFYVSGLTERGPVGTPTLIKSIANFEATFGGRTAYNSALYDTLRTFWEEGGAEAIVIRVAGQDAASGTISLNDTAETATVTLDASSPGAWSSNVKVSVETVPASNFAPERSKVVISGPVSNESYTFATAEEVVNAINARSVYVKASLTGEPDAKLAASEATAMSAGDDKRANVTAADVTAALDLAGTDWGSGAVAVPGYPADIVAEAVLQHAAKHNRVALFSGEATATQADVTGLAAEIANFEFAEYGALVYPWVVVPDGSSRRTAPPEGFAAAKRAVAHSQIGSWRAPAGDFSTAEWVVDTATPLGTGVNDELADANVTGIINTNGRVRLYGWWSLSPDADNYEMLTARDVLNTLAVQCADVLEPFVFEEIDGRGILVSRIESALVGVLDPISLANGFFPMRDAEGNEVDPGYRVVVDETLNTAESMAANKIVARVSVRLSPTANLIELEIVKVPFTATI